MIRPPPALKAALLVGLPLALLAADAPRAEPADAGSAPKPRPRDASMPDTSADVLNGTTITPRSLCEEIRRTLQQKQDEFAKLDEERRRLLKERADFEKQRAQLEQLSQSIAAAREELKKETQRLEELSKPPPETSNDPASDEAVAEIAATPLSPQAVETVAKRMRAMKPEAAAAVVKRLDPGLAAMILMKMRPADSGAIIGKLDADLAAELITLAATGEVPTP
jgi:flagellar motility protein MotE (MotC chaperone)